MVPLAPNPLFHVKGAVRSILFLSRSLFTTPIYREDANRRDDTLGYCYPNYGLGHFALVRFDTIHLLLNHLQHDDTLFDILYPMSRDDGSSNSHFAPELDCNEFRRDRLRRHPRHRTATDGDSSDSVQNDGSYADRSNSNFLHLNSKKIVSLLEVCQ